MILNRHDDIFSYPHLWGSKCAEPYESVRQAPAVTGLYCPCHSFDKALIIELAQHTGGGS